MLKAKPQNILWDDCVKLELYVHYHTSHNIYCLNGEMPETIRSGETSNISKFLNRSGRSG